MAFVFGDPSAPDAVMEPSITQMRCSWCKELKPCCACAQGECRHSEASEFPPFPKIFAKPLGKMARMNSNFVREFIRNEGLTENALAISGGTPDVFG